MRVAVSGRKLDEAQPVAMRVEPHRLGIDGDHRPQVDIFGQVTAIKPMGHPRQPAHRAFPEPRWCPGENSNFHELSPTRT